MNELKMWRWAPYMIVGAFATVSIVLFSFPIGVGAEQLPRMHTSGWLLLIAALALWSHLFGAVIWSASLHLWKPILLPFSLTIPRQLAKLDLGAGLEGQLRSYHDLRVAYCLDFLRRYDAELKKAPASDYETGDISGYSTFLVTMLRTNVDGRRYLSQKIISEWEACTFMLALLGSLCLALTTTLIRLLLDVTNAIELASPWCPYVLGFLCLAVVYTITGTAYLQRTKLFGRDVAVGILVMGEQNAPAAAPND